MIASHISTPELPRLATVRQMLRSPGPCITIVLPPYRPGEQAASPVARLKANLQDAARELSGHRLPKSAVDDLLQPLERFTAEPASISGAHWGRIIFRSPSTLEVFQVTQPVDAALRIGGSFWIRKIAADLARPRSFYLLALSQTKVSLLRCAGLHAEAAKLPAGVPDTLAEAMAMKPPDHDLVNRSVVHGSTGTMRGVRFGTGSGREREHTHLRDFYKLIDRALQEVEPEAPLILSGVEEDVAMFRAASTYRNLVQGGITGNPDLQEPSELLQQAYGLLRADATVREAAALSTARERTASRFSTDLIAILHAAFEGRVSHLYLDESAEQMDVFERRNYRSWGKEDLLNLAAVQTMIHHGKVAELPPGVVSGAAAAAVMRF